MIQEKYLIHQNNSKPCAFQITPKMAYSFHHVWIVRGFAIYDHWLISSSLSCQSYTNAILQRTAGRISQGYLRVQISQNKQ